MKNFTDELRDQITIFVLLGDEKAKKPVRYFIAINHEIENDIHCPPNWEKNAFMPLSAIERYENRWDIL